MTVPVKKLSRGEISAKRIELSKKRKTHIQSVKDGSYEEILPKTLAPSLFKDIEDVYWNCLGSIEDPRNPSFVIYPLDLILHRIISGLLDGTSHIGILFPKKQQQSSEENQRHLGKSPTRPAVYQLLRNIDWDRANVVLAPLWECLGYQPDLVVKRPLRDSKVILEEFREEQKQLDLADKTSQIPKKKIQKRRNDCINSETDCRSNF